MCGKRRFSERQSEIRRPRDLVHQALAASTIRTRAGQHATNFLHRATRPKVSRPDKKHNALDESECVVQHEVFHFSIVTAAPMTPGEERPSDLDLARCFVIPVEPRRPNDPPIDLVLNEQRATARQRLVEEVAENGLLVSLPDWMLLPDEGVGGNREQRVTIRLAQWRESHESAGKKRLKVKRQRVLPLVQVIDHALGLQFGRVPARTTSLLIPSAFGTGPHKNHTIF